MSTLSINCLLLGSDSSEIFPVKILETENVGFLKRLIKEEQSPRLNHVVASGLTVWKVSLPVDTITPELTVDDVEAQELHPVKKISSIFGKALVDEHVHILVRVPTADSNLSDLYKANIELTLFCWVLNASNHCFPVDIGKSKTVDYLKKMIKKEKERTFAGIEADTLELWKLSPPISSAEIGTKLRDVQSPQMIPGCVKLNDMDELSSHFSSTWAGHLHIIVEAPPTQGLGTKDAGEEEKRDQIPALHERFKNVISRILKAEAPAEIAYSIYDGRYKANKPRTSVAPPVQLFNPAFGHFLDDMKSNHALPDNIVRQTTEYMKAATAIYESEEKRRNVLTPLLCAILEVNIQTILNEDKTNADDIVEVMINALRFLIFLQEDRNEFGDGGSDPSTQAGLSVARCWSQPKYEKLRNASACPTFLVATAGPWIAILGAVITDGVIVQRLTDYIWVGLDSVLSESHIAQVARTFYALKASLKKLTSCYESLDPTGDLPANSRYFPSITAYRPHDGGHVNFEYVGFLENCPDCITLHARTKPMPTQDVVVKFVDRYGQRAHQILADQGLAPKLLYCGSPHLDDDEPSYQSISMVVMEYIDGDTFAVAKQKMSEESVETVRSAVRRALELLHNHGLVFGDLRPPNVMITNDGKVKLIDFNWAGEEGQAKYPSLISPEIAWPEGVKALAVMRREHDLDMLREFI